MFTIINQLHYTIHQDIHLEMLENKKKLIRIDIFHTI